MNFNCDYILFTKLPWPGNSKGTFRSSSQAATCPPVYYTRRRLHTVPLIAECQAGKMWIPIFIIFGLTRPGIKPESTVSVADALSTRSLIGHRAKVLKMAMAYAVEVCSRIFKIRLFVAVGLLHWVTVLRIIRFPYYNPFLIRGSGSCSGWCYFF